MNILGKLYCNRFHFIYRFDVHHACFFTSAIRSRIVHFILDRKRFTLGEDDDYAFGIDRLIDQGVYTAAYPLHDVSGRPAFSLVQSQNCIF